jgi:hypothetical protein
MKNKASYIFRNSKSALWINGLVFIVIFLAIYLVCVYYTKNLNYISFFFNNILANLPLAIATGFHVSLLAFGILLLISAFFFSSPTISLFDDRFEIVFFLHPKRVVPLKEITSIKSKIYTVVSKKRYIKECRIFFYNKEYNFSLAYPVVGYFDDTIIENNQIKHEMQMRNYRAEKMKTIALVKKLKEDYKIKTPFLP